MFSVLLTLAASRQHKHHFGRRHFFRPLPKTNGGDSYGYVMNTDKLSVYDKASKSGSTVVKQPKRGKLVELLEYSNTWYHISVDGTKGYAEKAYIGQIDMNTNIGKIMYKGRSRLQASYKAGKSGPGQFDGPGFVSYIYTEIGKTLPTTLVELAGAGREPSDFKAGDVLFFAVNGGSADHCAVITDAFTLLHASPLTKNVCEEEFTSEWTPRLVAIRRYM